MSKHAYLIMAHREFSLLKKLVLLLDDPRNDIYVHVDKKSTDFQVNQFQNITSRSSLHFISRHGVNWGGFSQINVELELLHTAVKGEYSHYHLLSGADLPIKSQDEIHSFFSSHPGAEFLYYDNKRPMESFYERVKYFHFLQERLGHAGRRNPLFHINRLMLTVQKHLGVDRIRDAGPNLRKGTAWYSITHELANYVLSQENEIHKRYSFTFCADELFLHSLVWNSDFKDRVYGSSLRYIDWERGQPYTFRLEDYDTLMNCTAFWARKFSEKIDANIVDRIYTYLKT